MILTRYRTRRDARIRRIVDEALAAQSRQSETRIANHLDALNSRHIVLTANGAEIARVVAQGHRYR